MARPATTALVLMALATVTYSLIGALAKYAASAVPSSQVVFFRSLVTTVVLLGWLVGRRKMSWKRLLGRNRPVLVLRGVLGAIALNLYFYALSGLPVADALALLQVFPVFVLPLAAVFLGEPVQRSQVLLAPLALAGVVLVLRPGFQMVNLFGLAALGAALLSAGAHVSIRKLASEEAITVVLYFAVFATAGSVPLMLPACCWPDARVWAALAGLGLLSVLAQLLMTVAYRHDRAGRVALVANLGVIFAGVWDFVFWGRTPHWSTVAGAALIIGACIEMQRRRPGRPHPSPH